MRNVLVTGGSRGLGFGIARELVAGGFRVIALARKPGDQLAAAIAET
jgi:3-oxoacyl-[acyl-carrier protein] reductase